MTESTLAEVAATSFDDYSPRLVASAVNDLRPLGRDEALQRIRAAGAQVPPPPDATGLLWVARTLFDLPPGIAFPPVRLGAPDISPPRDPAALPRFPVAIYRDIPFLLVRGYVLSGLPEGLDAHLAFYADQGTVRAVDLSPPPADADLVGQFMSHLQNAYGAEAAPPVTDVITAQIERLGG
jgi:hypothetical protein